MFVDTLKTILKKKKNITSIFRKYFLSLTNYHEAVKIEAATDEDDNHDNARVTLNLG